jgi:hypothetical protein
MAKIINPLAWNVPIVNPETGYPTEYFKRILEDISDAKISASLIEALGGDPDEDQVVTWDDTAGDLAFKPASDVLDMIDDTHGAILYRDSADWQALAPGTDGDVLTTHGASADPTWEPPSGSGGDWALAGSGFTDTGVWSFAADGASGTLDFTNLGTPNEIFIIMDAVTKSVSGSVNIRVSTDNGSTFYSGGTDHFFMDANGVATGNSVISQMHNTNATAARTAFSHIIGANGPRAICLNLTVGASHRIFRGSTSPINAVRLLASGGGNFNGGAFYVKTR